MSQVAELEPLHAQTATGCADSEAADALADADPLVADALDVCRGGDGVRVAGAPDLDGLDGEPAAGRADGDRGTSTLRALVSLPADGGDVCLETDHLALQLGDLDCLETKSLALRTGARRPADALYMRGDAEVRPRAGIVRLRRSGESDDAHGGQDGSGDCRATDAPVGGTRTHFLVVHECFIPVHSLFRRQNGTTLSSDGQYKLECPPVYVDRLNYYTILRRMGVACTQPYKYIIAYLYILVKHSRAYWINEMQPQPSTRFHTYP